MRLDDPAHDPEPARFGGEAQFVVPVQILHRAFDSFRMGRRPTSKSEQREAVRDATRVSRFARYRNSSDGLSEEFDPNMQVA
jgi:hypothetical protein